MKQLFSFAKTKKKEIIFSTVLSSLGAILSIVPYALIYYVINYFLTNGFRGNIQDIFRIILISGAALLLNYIFTVSAFVFSHIAAFNLLYDIRIKLTSHLGKLPIGFWNENNSGKVRKIIQEDVEFIENFIAHHLPDAASGLILPIATLGFLCAMDWRLALMTAIPLVLGLFFIKMMWSGIGTGKNRKELLNEYSKSLESMHSASVEFVRGMQVVKVFNISAASFKKLKDSVSLYKKLVIKWSKGMTPYWAIFTSIILGGAIFILPLGFDLLKGGKISVPKLLLFLLLGTGCFGGFINLITISSHSELIAEGARRIETIFNEKPLPEPDNPAAPTKHDIEINNLNFCYNGNGKNVLNNISAYFPEGSFTALVGPSGAGKTTLVHLISRMWDVAEGQILIGGINLKQIGSKGITGCVGTIFQDVHILTDTVRSNIMMDKKDASLEDIENAARVAACDEFINVLPKGYDTVIGDGGEYHLSGGEKQRIALARVVLKNPPVILLDEATCYADANSETQIQEAFARIMVNKTVVVIAHRLSTIVKADNILVVDKGCIVERGAHKDLIDQKGLYFRMWQAHTEARCWHMKNRGEVK